MSVSDGFSQRLRFTRINAGLSQKELCDLTGIARSQLSRYESGYSGARDDIVAKLAKALGVTYGWLAHGNKDEYRITTVDMLPLFDGSHTVFVTLQNNIYDKLIKLASLHETSVEDEASTLLLRAVEDSFDELVSADLLSRSESIARKIISSTEEREIKEAAIRFFESAQKIHNDLLTSRSHTEQNKKLERDAIKQLGENMSRVEQSLKKTPKK